MLSPNINTAKVILTDSLNEMLAIDSFSHTAQNTQVGFLAKDPAWLSAVRSRVAMMAKEGASWELDRPNIWSSLLVQVTDYASSFAGIAEIQESGQLTTAAQWVNTMEAVLAKPLQTAITNTTNANDAIDKHYENFNAIIPLLKDSIDKGWAELAAEEQEMIRIAAALATLQAQVGQLEDKVTSGMISGGTSYVKSAVNIIYNIVTASGGGIPYLTIASMAYTVGKTPEKGPSQVNP
jgi:hypothetical protein